MGQNFGSIHSLDRLHAASLTTVMTLHSVNVTLLLMKTAEGEIGRYITLIFKSIIIVLMSYMNKIC